MSGAAQNTRNWGDVAKWLVVFALLAAGVFGNYYFAEQPVIYRVLALLALAIAAGVVAYYTQKGRAFWDLVQGARSEIRRVIWPTQQETTQTTIVVVIMCLILGLFLFGLDSLFGWLGSLIY